MTNRWKNVVAAAPHATAFASAGREIDFAEADRLSDRLARNVLAATADSGPLGLFVDLSVGGLVALLGALKTGRPVVPLDPHLPAGRLQVIAEIAGVRTCLVDDGQEALARGLAPLPTELLSTRELLEDAPGDETAPLPHRSGEDPAVVVFTSGSTGRPKGVALTHDVLMDSADTAADVMGVSSHDRMLLAMPLSFTAGAIVFAVAILNGAGTWAFDPRDRGVAELGPFLREHRLTTFHGTPHLLRSITAALAPNQVIADLRLVVTAGEALFARDVEGFRPHLTADAVIANWAGSSEVGSLSSYLVRSGDVLPEGALPAGLPQSTKEVRILRPDGSEAATGESGEVVITSHHLSGGYWNDPERTAEKFTTEPDGRRTYRMGDLGKVDEHGNLSLLGRMDGGVKVRGYLVELSEVEGALLTEPSLAEACVVAVTAGDVTRLVGYVSPVPGLRAESPAAIRRRLRSRLPEYMVPATIVQLPELPRTERGKVDRQSLPAVPEREVGAPAATREEKALAEIWRKVLGLAEVGNDEDFWELGGDSLSVEEMLVLAQSRFSVQLVASDLVDAPTLSEFAARISRASTSLPTHPTALTLRAGGHRTPLFCFAGAGALGAAFVALARHTADRPVYAFQSQGIERRAFPDWSVARQARRHLQVLRVVQPSGPYLLAGHSLGGLVALEVAHLLRESGEEVALLTMLDTYLPSSAAKQGDSSGVVPSDGMSSVEFLEPPAPPVADPRARPLRRGASLLTQKVREYRRRSKNVPLKLLMPFAGVVQFEGPRQFGVFFEQGMVVARRHHVRPYDGRTLLFLAQDNPDGIDAWKPFLTGALERRQFPSDHNSLLREPHVALVAEVLAAEIDAVGA